MHGGQLKSIQARYDNVIESWLDLSTGVSPFSYPIDASHLKSTQQLPDQSNLLRDAAKSYYGAVDLKMVPGSIWAICHLPIILKSTHNLDASTHRVLLPRQGFSEHKNAWQEHGFQLDFYEQYPTQGQLKQANVCVVINPNNPSAQIMNEGELRSIYHGIKENSGVLIVDEAFIDCDLNRSVSHWPETKNACEHIVILKSFGKFFGLPGLRIGSVIACSKILKTVDVLLGPWPINTLGEQVAIQAFQDIDWQKNAKKIIEKRCAELHRVLKTFFNDIHNTALFNTVYTHEAETIYAHLLTNGIYVRLLDDKTGLRFGLPSSESQLKRLEAVFIQYPFKRQTL